ncbi:diacylglycerol kinase family protein [Microbacterium sediminicola]|uniref:Diacylglycerol kinase family protein n=1 Tax=Microbacterium sediminicola TaxID=415210 RepID=A0ABP4UBJ7_9MICO
MPPSPDAAKRAALVYNPIKVDEKSLRALVEKESAAAGWGAPHFFETTVDDSGQGVTGEAVAAGAAAVLVAGGDGTVRAVAEALTGTSVPLTIVPSGTGNLLARNLSLPLSGPAPMVRATFEGDHHHIDVGIAGLQRADGTREEHAFVVMGGMGMDAAMIANTNSDLKKRLGWIAYVDGAARSLLTNKPFRIIYQVAGQKLRTARVQSVLFANCGSLPAGLTLIPEASLADGQLDVAVVQPKGLFGWVLVWRRVAWLNSALRRILPAREVHALRTQDTSILYSRGTSVDISPEAAQPVQLDGDEFGEAVAIHCRVEKDALVIAVPPGHDVSQV